MARYTGDRTPLQKARRDGAVLFALAALVAFFFGQWQLQLVPEDAPLVAAVGGLGMAVAGWVGAAFGRWYLEGEFRAATTIILPALSLVITVMSFGLVIAVFGQGGPLLLIAVTPWPVLLGGGLIASFAMYQRYRGRE